MDRNQRTKAFYDFANSLDSGHLKEWKAGGMLMEMEMFPEITEDFGYCLNYVQGCLRMEGFSDRACVLVTDYVRKLDFTTQHAEHKERQRAAMI